MPPTGNTQTHVPGSAATRREVRPGWWPVMELERVGVAGGWLYVWRVTPSEVTFFARDRRGDNRKLAMPPCSGPTDLPGIPARVEVDRAYPSIGRLSAWVVVRLTLSEPAGVVAVPVSAGPSCFYCDQRPRPGRLTCGGVRCPEDVAGWTDGILRSLSGMVGYRRSG